jgi:hypothetical protein
MTRVFAMSNTFIFLLHMDVHDKYNHREAGNLEGIWCW